MISVLISVYNENRNEIIESFDSILSQSYSDFELIVVVDKPDNEEAIALLNQYAKKDDRVKIIINEKNIGLAMSMNVAAEAASGEYFLRMDSDDVCYPERFKKQYDFIKNSDYDLVCGNYDFIDEDGTFLPQKATVYSDKQLSKLLPLRNIIHHPTVIMRADKFREVGGYRDYPCAQDYDLWLRMKCAGCKMHMMPEKLIKYRVRQASTTIRKRYKQSCTGEYIRSLYHQRKRMSGYSYEGYLSYLEKRNVNDHSANEDYILNSERYAGAKQKIKKGHIVKGASDFFGVLFRSKYFRPHILHSMKIALISRFFK